MSNDGESLATHIREKMKMSAIQAKRLSFRIGKKSNFSSLFLSFWRKDTVFGNPKQRIDTLNVKYDRSMSNKL